MLLPPRPTTDRTISASERARRIATPEAQRLLVAARKLIARRGAGAANINAIAAECGLAGTSLLYHFGTKGRLLVELLRQGHERLAGLLNVELRGAAAPAEAAASIARVLEGYLPEAREGDRLGVVAEATGRAAGNREVALLLGQERAYAAAAITRELAACPAATRAAPPEQVAALIVVVVDGAAALPPGSGGALTQDALTRIFAALLVPWPETTSAPEAEASGALG